LFPSKSTFLRYRLVNISKYFFLIVFFGFFVSTTFFDHAHIYKGDIIVHSHPFKPDANGNPSHNHTGSGYLLVFLLDNFIAKITVPAALVSVYFCLIRYIISGKTKCLPEKPAFSYFLRRGPPSSFPA